MDELKYIDLNYHANYKTLRLLIYPMDNYICHICNTFVKESEIALDHIIPKTSINYYSFKSSDSYWNLRLAHKRCNSKKSNRLIGSTQLRLPFDTETVKIGGQCVRIKMSRVWSGSINKSWYNYKKTFYNTEI